MSSEWFERSKRFVDQDIQIANATGRRWVFTWNNPEKEIDTSEFAKHHIRYMIYQVEEGESGTTHYQGYIECTQNKTWKSLSDKVMGSNRIHWEKAKGTAEQCIHYCSKPILDCKCHHCESARNLGQVSDPKEWGSVGVNGRPKREDSVKKNLEHRRQEVRWFLDRAQEGWTSADFINEDPVLWFDQKKDISSALEAISELKWENHRISLKEAAMEKLETLNTLQKTILKHLREQDDRRITFVVDRKGGSGKTVMCEILEHIYGYQGFHNARSADIAQSVRNDGPKDGYVIDLARSLQKTDTSPQDIRDDFINYQVIENLKDGRLFASKWNSSMIRLKRPKVLVLMNFYPRVDKLSEDRWDIINWNGSGTDTPPPKLEPVPITPRLIDRSEPEGSICMINGEPYNWEEDIVQDPQTPEEEEEYFTMYTEASKRFGG